MRIGGLTTTTALVKAHDGAAWRNLLADPRGPLQLLKVPWPLYLAPGRLIFYDDMEGVLKWAGLFGLVTRDNTLFVFDGDYCLKLATPLEAGETAYAARSLPFTGRGKFRFMCHWYAKPELDEATESAIRSVGFGLEFYDGTNILTLGVQFLQFEDGNARRKWQYYDATGTWSDIPGGDQFIIMELWSGGQRADNFLAVDVDITDGTPKIDRLVSNGLDLSGLNLTGYSAAETRLYPTTISLNVMSNEIRVCTAYFDDVALGDIALP